MRTSTALSALFAIGALAVPLNFNRALIEDIIVVTVTDYVYADAPPPTTTTSTTTPAYTPPVVIPTTTSTTPAYTPPVVVPSTTSTTSIYTPPPPPPSTSPVVPAPAVVTPAPAPVVQAASPASNGAPTTLVPDLDVTSPTYAAIALQHHNVHRANHSAEALVYNQTLASWAQTKAESCVWDESFPAGVSGVGMNIAQGTYLGAGNLSAVISDMWYNSELAEFPGYGIADLDVTSSAFQDWGHFSQVVWKGTTAVGCGTSQCSAGTSIGSGYFVACLYFAPGNYVGDFTQVGAPLGYPTVAVVGNQIIGF
ncbi:Mucin-2 [Xylographa soralifera]|nr:Mucin-2 [Xylographa soralifera]